MKQKYKKIFLSIIVLFALCIFPAGCAEKQTGTETAEEAPLSIPTEEFEDKVPDAGIYNTVLDNYAKALFGEDSMTSYIKEYGLSNLLLSYADPQKVGYAFADGNKDGVEELYIVPVDEEDNVILAMYMLNTTGTGEIFTSSFREKWYLSSENSRGIMLGDYFVNSSKDYGLTMFDYVDDRYDAISGVQKDGDLWYDSVNGDAKDENFAENYISQSFDSFVKPGNITAFSDMMIKDEDESEESGDSKSGPGKYIPSEITRVIEAAGEDDLLAVWVNPSDELLLYFGEPKKIDDSLDTVAVLTLQDEVSIKVYSLNEDLFNDTLDKRGFIAFNILLSDSPDTDTRSISARVEGSEVPSVLSLDGDFDEEVLIISK